MLMDCPTCQTIFDGIQENPGIRVMDLPKSLNLARRNVRKHFEKMEMLGIVGSLPLLTDARGVALLPFPAGVLI